MLNENSEFLCLFVCLFLLTLQISTNAMKPARVTPTPRATTREVHISVSAKPGTKAMVFSAKVKYCKIWEFSLKYLTKY